MVEIANRIELGQIRAGMVVACETAREINEIVIEQMLADTEHGLFQAFAGDADRRSGAVAVLLDRRLVLASPTAQAPGWRDPDGSAVSRALPLGHRGRRSPASGHQFHQFTSTDSAAVLTHGVELGAQTWQAFLRRLGWTRDQVDKVICHQVGSGPSRDDPQVAGRFPSRGTFRPIPTSATWGPCRCR